MLLLLTHSIKKSILQAPFHWQLREVENVPSCFEILPPEILNYTVDTNYTRCHVISHIKKKPFDKKKKSLLYNRRTKEGK